MQGKDRPKEAPESVQRIEPTTLAEPTAAIADLAAELAAASAVLGQSLHPRTAASLADMVRLMNTYYSNLIEGHKTRPRDIEAALEGELSEDPQRRNFQLEAAAHVRVQVRIDRDVLNGNLPDPASVEFLKGLHLEFYQDVPSEMLLIEGAGRSFQMVPGEWRSAPEHDVAVGRHVPPSSSQVDAFMHYFAHTYAAKPTLGKASRLVALAAAHHRFNFIHPFPDGNGRVSRLMSHAMAQTAGVGAHGLWSISRGLARGLASRTEYKSMMDRADSPRSGDLDGRGNLSKRALEEFTEWFLKVCLDQVNFMAGLFDLRGLSERVRLYVQRNDTLKPEAARLLEEVLLRGELERGEVSRATGMPERSARRLLQAVEDLGLLKSETPKGVLSLRFPTHAQEVLFPRLFPET